MAPSYDESHEDAPLKPSKPSSNPLPREFWFVILIMWAEPICGTVIYPFINALVRETGVTHGDEAKTGYYAGVIESLYFVGEMISVVAWAKLSDRYGRRPILLWGQLILAASLFSFGASKAFWQLFVSRLIQGIANGNIGVTKSVVAEATDSTNRARAFGGIPLVWAIGVTIGPFIGGFFANPADHWPALFGRYRYLVTHPYFLPCAVMGTMVFIIFIIVYIGLRETSPIVLRRKARKSKSASSTPIETECSHLLDHHEALHYNGAEPLPLTLPTPEPEPRSASIREVFGDRNVAILLLNMAFLAFWGQCQDVLLPLMLSTSVPLGGLGFDPRTIGLIMGSMGLANGLIISLFLARVVDKYGARTVYATAYKGMLFVFPAYPLLNWLAVRAGGHANWSVWTLLVLQLFCASAPYACYGTIYMLFIDHTTDEELATVNALGQMINSSLRSLAPVFATSLFAVSVEKNILGGTLVFWICSVGVAMAVWVTTKIPKSGSKRRE